LVDVLQWRVTGVRFLVYVNSSGKNCDWFYVLGVKTNIVRRYTWSFCVCFSRWGRVFMRLSFWGLTCTSFSNCIGSCVAFRWSKYNWSEGQICKVQASTIPACPTFTFSWSTF